MFGFWSSSDRSIFYGDPAFAGKMLPGKSKLAFGLLLSILINPLVPANLELSTHFAGAILLALNEICIGLMLAMMVRMVFCRVGRPSYFIRDRINGK